MVSFYRIYLHIFPEVLFFLLVEEGATGVFTYWKRQGIVLHHQQSVPCVPVVCSVKGAHASFMQALKWELNPCHTERWISTLVGSLKGKYFRCACEHFIFL